MTQTRIAAELALLLLFVAACQTTASPTPVPPPPPATALLTEDIRPAVIQSVLGTLTAAAPALANQTAVVPTPTPSRTPTITLTPNVTPTSTPTLTQGLHFITLRWGPPNPFTGDTIVYLVTFENTLTQLQQIRWRVESMDVDNNPTWTKLFFATEPAVTDVVMGRYEFAADPPWRINTSAGKRNFMLRVVELDNTNRVVRVLSTPTGQVDFPTC